MIMITLSQIIVSVVASIPNEHNISERYNVYLKLKETTAEKKLDCYNPSWYYVVQRIKSNLNIADYDLIRIKQGYESDDIAVFKRTVMIEFKLNANKL